MRNESVYYMADSNLEFFSVEIMDSSKGQTFAGVIVDFESLGLPDLESRRVPDLSLKEEVSPAGAEIGKLSHASVYLAANVLNAAIPFFLLPILTRVLAPAEYGAVATFEAVVACLAVFTGLSTHGAVAVHYYKEDRTTFSQYVGNCLIILVGSTLLTAAVVGAIPSLMIKFTGLSVSWLMLAILVSFAQFLINIRLVIWQVQNKAFRYGVFQIGQTAINAAVSLLLVLVLRWGGVGRITGIAFAIVFAGLVGYASMQVHGWISWKWKFEYLRDALHFGVPLIPHTLGTLAVAFADRFIITQKLGMGATGTYFVAIQLSMPMLMMGSSFNRAFVPWLFDKLSRNENAVGVLVSYCAILAFLLIGSLYGAVVYFGLPHVVGRQYRQTLPIALLLIIGTTFQAAYYAVVNYIFYAKKTVHLSCITFMAGLLCVIGGWFAVSNYGLIGMASVFTIIQGMTFFLVWLASSIVLPQPWFDFSAMRKAFHA